MSDVCIHCGEELSIIERNRCECFNCRDKITTTYSDDELIPDLQKITALQSQKDYV